MVASSELEHYSSFLAFLVIQKSNYYWVLAHVCAKQTAN